MRVGFIGLGAMGYGMAHCINQDHDLIVYNRTAEKAKGLLAEGAKIASCIDDLKDCEVICSMLSDDSAVESVFLQNGSLPSWMRKEIIHLSHSTISPHIVKKLSAAHNKAGISFICAPVLGRPDKAAERQLTVIVAGFKSEVLRCKSVINSISRSFYWVGENPSKAAITKIGINFLVATALEALVEGFTLIRKAGIDPDIFQLLLTETIFNSQVYNAYAPLVARELSPDLTFKMVHGLKDVSLARSEANALQISMPLADLVAERISAAIAEGYGNDDWSSLAKFSARNAGLSAI